MHFKLMYPSIYLGAPDLLGKDVRVVIESIKEEELVGSDGKKQCKPILRFRGKSKAMVCCKTNAASIAKLHGTEVDDWPGKTVTLYPTTCQAFGETKECIRIR